jgi:hypothetical protein
LRSELRAVALVEEPRTIQVTQRRWLIPPPSRVRSIHPRPTRPPQAWAGYRSVRRSRYDRTRHRWSGFRKHSRLTACWGDGFELPGGALQPARGGGRDRGPSRKAGPRSRFEGWYPTPVAQQATRISRSLPRSSPRLPAARNGYCSGCRTEGPARLRIPETESLPLHV